MKQNFSALSTPVRSEPSFGRSNYYSTACILSVLPFSRPSTVRNTTFQVMDEFSLFKTPSIITMPLGAHTVMFASFSSLLFALFAAAVMCAAAVTVRRSHNVRSRRLMYVAAVMCAATHLLLPWPQLLTIHRSNFHARITGRRV